MADWWHDGGRAKEISDALREAWDALDRAYYSSVTNEDLLLHASECSEALMRVRRHARKNGADGGC